MATSKGGGRVTQESFIRTSRQGVDVPTVEELYRQLLKALGEDPDREGLRETPRRVAGWWSDFLDHEPGRLATVFEHTSCGQQWVALSGISTWSLCEHHLLPFHAEVTIAYLPTGWVAGLSKLVRIVTVHAQRLQLQERLTAQIAQHVSETTGSPDVGVWVTGEHLCMSMRGVRAQNARTTTACLLGRLHTDHQLTDRLHQAAQNKER